MTTHTHQTAPTQYVEARGIRFAYRRFGKSGSVPLVFEPRLAVSVSRTLRRPRVPIPVRRRRTRMSAPRPLNQPQGVCI
jgi:hypothetical protein